jgi:hypothetical protein
MFGVATRLMGDFINAPPPPSRTSVRWQAFDDDADREEPSF